ncbi:major capsid protein [Corynebacterium callunae]|uniref:major capsid protein n=1 Tax=Corynebacterium callunae TaxID=1721 RepID=UPI002000462A|nr:phage capsid protein [Corynebacterium callunae]MCK2199191.1 phage capsid protein [Corynebacterium callunae]
MAITLAQAALNTQDDYDTTVINEFRKSSALLDVMQFAQAVNPAGGGATLDYSYRRQITQRSADFRAIGSEYSPEEVTTQKFSTTLAEIGGAYQIDRRIAHLGSAVSDEISLQTSNLVTATMAKFNDAIINGDTAVDADGFDGLDKALTGSTTELDGTGIDWSGFTDATSTLPVIDRIDELMAELDGPATVLIANKAVMAKLRAAGRRANMYVASPVEGLNQDNGITVMRHSFGGVILIDPGAKAGTNDPVIPIDPTLGTTDIYAVRIGLNGFHGVTTAGGNIVRTLFPDFTTAGAVKKGEVYLENVGTALKATKAAAVLRGVKVR